MNINKNKSKYFNGYKSHKFLKIYELVNHNFSINHV